MLHTKGARVAAVAFRGFSQTIQAVCTDGQRHKDGPRNPNAGGTRLHNDALQGACACTARLERKPGRSPDPTQGKRHDIPALARSSPPPSRCRYLFSSNREHHKKKRVFKWWHQRNRSYSHFAALHQLNEVSEKDVSVPLAETLSVIGHLQQGRAPREKKKKA